MRAFFETLTEERLRDAEPVNEDLLTRGRRAVPVSKLTECKGEARGIRCVYTNERAEARREEEPRPSCFPAVRARRRRRVVPGIATDDDKPCRSTRIRRRSPRSTTRRPPTPSPASSLVVDFRDDESHDTIAALGKQLGVTFTPASSTYVDVDESTPSTPATPSQRAGRSCAPTPTSRPPTSSSPTASPRTRSTPTTRRSRRATTSSAAQGFPNDPRYKEQWHLRPDPHAGRRGRPRRATASSSPSSTPASPRSTDLAARPRFVAGWNFVTNNANANDDHGHGTHVAGTIAQSTHNGIGVAGVAFNAKIMPIKVLSARGSGSVARHRRRHPLGRRPRRQGHQHEPRRADALDGAGEGRQVRPRQGRRRSSAPPATTAAARSATRPPTRTRSPSRRRSSTRPPPSTRTGARRSTSRRRAATPASTRTATAARRRAAEHHRARATLADRLLLLHGHVDGVAARRRRRRAHRRPGRHRSRRRREGAQGDGAQAEGRASKDYAEALRRRHRRRRRGRAQGAARPTAGFELGAALGFLGLMLVRLRRLGRAAIGLGGRRPGGARRRCQRPVLPAAARSDVPAASVLAHGFPAWEPAAFGSQARGCSTRRWRRLAPCSCSTARRAAAAGGGLRARRRREPGVRRHRRYGRRPGAVARPQRHGVARRRLRLAP